MSTSRAPRPSGRSTTARSASSARSNSAATLAIAQVCEQRQVPFVINIAAAPQITEQGYKYLVRNFQTGAQLVTNGLRLIKDLIGGDQGRVQDRGVPARQRHVRHRAARRRWTASSRPRSMPFQLVESRSPTIRRRRISPSRSRKIRAINPDLVLVVTRVGRRHQAGARHGAPALRAEGDHLARLARPVRRGVLPGARAALRLSRSTICPGPIRSRR